MDIDPHELVRTAEAAYRDGDIERCLGLFEPDAEIVWNNKVVARDPQEARRFHEALLPGPLDLRKRLVSADGDRLVVQWRASWPTPEGRGVEQCAFEVWDLTPAGTLRRWEAVEHRRTTEGAPRDVEDLWPG